jgi:uncharacterized protein (DUF302 family)
MTVRDLQFQRINVISHRSFADVVTRVEEALGHPDMPNFRRSMAEAQTERELEQVVERAIGRSGLMEFARFELGEVMRKDTGASTPNILRLVAGNPLVMKRMVKFVPDAGSYAPVTILIDERADGVHLSYDRMESLLASYGNTEALSVARDLDTKVETMLLAAAN